MLVGLGCGQGGASKQMLPERTLLTPPPAETPAPLALPNPNELLKSVQYLDGNRAKDGATFEAETPFTFSNLVGSESLGVFSPQWTGAQGMSLTDLAYGIYSFALPDYDQTGIVGTSWLDGFAPRDGQAVYIGLANFDTDAWSWFTLQSDQVSVGVFTPYLSPTGVALVVVSVLGTDECRLERLRIGENILPEADLQVDTSYGPPALVVNFDASASLDHDGGIASYSWDFDGDGTEDLAGATETQPQHTYSTSGDYPATLTVTDDEGGSAEVVVDIFVNLPPTAGLSGNPLIGSAPLLVAFNAGGSSDPEGQLTDIQWDFDGDGVFNEAGPEIVNQGQALAEYTYNPRGLHHPAVKVTDHHGEEDTASVEVSVNSPPVARLTATPVIGQVPIDVSFDATTSTDSDGTIDDYEWDFDGNGTFNEIGGEADSRGIVDPVYNYTLQGGYAATLRVTDNDGGQATASKFIELGGTWEHTWGLTGDQKFYDAATDSAGNVYATGDSANTTNSVLLAKFGPSGTLQWTKTWHSPTSSDQCYGRGIEVDGSGSVYVTGHITTRADGKNDDVILLKFDSGGNLVWDVAWGGEYFYTFEYNPLPEIMEIKRNEYGADIAINPGGDVFLTGYAYYNEYRYFETVAAPYFFEYTITVTTLALVKIDPAGNLVFQRDYNIGDYSRGEGIALDNPNDLVYCTGIGMSGGAETGLVAAWDQTGTFEQAFKWDSNGSTHAWGICVSPTGNFVVSGETNSFGQGGYDAFVFQAEPFSNADPQLVWERSWGGGSTEAAVGVCWDAASSQFLVGGLTNSVGNGSYDMFSLAYSDAGTLTNQQAWGTAGDELCLSIGSNETYGLPVAVGIGLNTTGATWTTVAGTGADISASWTRRTGNNFGLAYGTSVIEGSLSSISGVLDTGGGSEDGLVMQFTP